MLTMTPQARAISAFSLALLVLTGYLNRLAFAAFVATGVDVPGGKGTQFAMSLLTVVVAGAVLWFTHVVAEAGGPGWDTNLAQAGRLIAAIGLVVAVLATLGTLTSGDTAFYGSFSLHF